MADRLTIEVSTYAFSRLEKAGIKREGDTRVATLSDEDGNAFEVVFKKAPPAEKPKVVKKKFSRG